MEKFQGDGGTAALPAFDALVSGDDSRVRRPAPSDNDNAPRREPDYWPIKCLSCDASIIESHRFSFPALEICMRMLRGALSLSSAGHPWRIDAFFSAPARATLPLRRRGWRPVAPCAHSDAHNQRHDHSLAPFVLALGVRESLCAPAVGRISPAPRPHRTIPRFDSPAFYAPAPDIAFCAHYPTLFARSRPARGNSCTPLAGIREKLGEGGTGTRALDARSFPSPPSRRHSKGQATNE